MKDSDLDFLAKLLEENEAPTKKLPSPKSSAISPTDIVGSPNKSKYFDDVISKPLEKTLFNPISVDTPDTDTMNKIKGYLTEARTRATFKGTNPEMYQKLGREALDKAKDLASGVAKKAAKNPLKMIGGAAGILLSEMADASDLGPERGSDSAIIEDPSLPLEVREQALIRMKNKYLKPKEERDE